MNDAVPVRAQTAGIACDANAKKRWTQPTLARIDSNQAENAANPVGTDAVFSLGS